MLNITRGYNSVCAAGQMARGLELLAAYGQERRVFGQSLGKQPLFVSTLFKEELLSLASFLLTFRTAELLGKDESKTASATESDLLRLLTPITKLFTGKAAVSVTSEVVEGFGGAGYVEDTGIPSLFRDAQVFSIWEGATNVLSLDLLRVFEKTSALPAFFQEAERILKMADEKILRAHVQNLKKITSAVKPEQWMPSARRLAFHIAQVYAGLLMNEWAASDKSQAERLRVATQHWVAAIEKFELVPPTFEGDARQFFGEA